MHDTPSVALASNLGNLHFAICIFQFTIFPHLAMDFLSSDPARWLFAFWFAILGGAVGSFLNVVVYRLPAGLSILWRPGSHCPHCKHAIRGYDNVPVLAWLWLRGRCRDCGRPISARYPLVEAMTAALFLLLLIVEVFHEGATCRCEVCRPPASRRWIRRKHWRSACCTWACSRRCWPPR